jgi:P27 family predicted phage terminase small subunit
MGKRGRPARPAHIKLLQGERPDRINRFEPTPSEVEIPCPPGLDADVQEVWNRYAPDMIRRKVLTAWDVDTFLIVCRAVALNDECWRRIHDPCDDQGYGLIKKGSGGVIPNPLIRIMALCSADIAKFGGRFGMTPSDRASLKVDPEQAPADGAERLLS